MSSDTEARIRARAYAIWQEDGCPEGRHAEHWARAEADIRAEDAAGEAAAAPEPRSSEPRSSESPPAKPARKAAKRGKKAAEPGDAAPAPAPARTPRTRKSVGA